MYTVVSRGGRFWNGYKFVDNFRDAKSFKRLAEAKAVCSVLSRVQATSIYYDYDEESETLVYDSDKLVAPPGKK